MLSGCVTQDTFDEDRAKRSEREGKLEANITSVSQRLTALERRVDGLDKSFASLSEKMNAQSTELGAVSNQLEKAWQSALRAGASWQIELTVKDGKFAGLSKGEKADIRLYSPLLLRGDSLTVNQGDGKPQAFTVSGQTWTLKLFDGPPSKSWLLKPVLLLGETCEVQGEINASGANAASRKIIMSLGLKAADGAGFEMQGSITDKTGEGSPYQVAVSGMWPAK